MKKTEAKLETEIKKIYQEREAELNRIFSDYFSQFEKADSDMLKKLEAEEITQREYKAWRTQTFMSGKKWEGFLRKVDRIFLEIEQKATEVSNKYAELIFVEEYNQAGKDIAKKVKKL